MAYILYYADRGRGALTLIYLVAFLFGVFRLRLRQLLMLAGTAILGYGEREPGQRDSQHDELQQLVRRFNGLRLERIQTNDHDRWIHHQAAR
jgi:hypothetical protein